MAETLDNSKLIASICAATTDVFSTMIRLEAVPGEPVEEANSSGTVDGVVALIGLAGQWVGAGIIQCDATLARKLYCHLLMTDAEPAGDGVNEEVLDAVAEIANMIIGNVKNDVEAMVGTIGMGIPSVVYGRKFTTRNAGARWIAVPFTCDGASIWVKVCLTPPALGGSPGELLGRTRRFQTA
ncbi:MAG: chemotaxis protein CheX [Acidobacteriota bacterium]